MGGRIGPRETHRDRKVRLPVVNIGQKGFEAGIGGKYKATGAMEILELSYSQQWKYLTCRSFSGLDPIGYST